MTTLSKLSEFGITFQQKVIGRLLTNQKFLVNVSDALLPEYFENKAHDFIVDTILKYYRKYHTYPSIDKMNVEIKKIENEILRLSIVEQLREAYKSTDLSNDLEWVETEFTNFCTNQQVKKAIMTSVDLLSAGDYEGIKQLINNALKAGQDKNIGHIYEKDVETRYREDTRSPIPYPWKIFNDITDGGAGKGELILIFGNPKGGKSWSAIDIAAHAGVLGYNVVYYTLELSEAYVGKRIDAYLTKIPMAELTKNRSEIENKIKEIRGKIRIKEYSAGRASLDTIEAHQDKLWTQENFKTDLIIIDYLDLLKNRYKGRKDRLEDTNDIFIDARGFARERQVPLISPSQIGRGGAQDEVIQADKIAGSYQKIMIADFAVSLSRKRQDKVNGTGRWHIMGNRNGPDGMTYPSKINTSNGQIEIFDKPLDDNIEEDNSTTYNGINKDDKEYLKKNFFKTEE